MKNLAFLTMLLVAGCTIAPSETRHGKSSALTDESFRKSLEQKLAADVESIVSQTSDAERPVIAATKTEIARLKKAWSSKGPEHDILAARFKRADEAIAEGLTFPPEGGQHNQWYQCDSCQRGLVTIDEHHHQCPSCKRIYTGFPYDNVLYNRIHSRNVRSAEDAAWAWVVTGEKKYAEHAAAVLEGYADRYLKYPMISASVNDKSVDIAAGKNGKYRAAGHMQSQTLDESGTLVSLSSTYDLIFNSGILDDAIKKKIENDLLRAMAGSINVYKAGKSNWQTWHNSALLYSGAVTGDRNLIKDALLDEKNGFVAQLNTGVLPEGMWYENSWGYHYYTLSAMTLIAEGGRRLGIDLYSFPALRKMYFIAFDYLMDDGSLPRFGDAVQDSPAGRDVNEKAYCAYRDKRLLSALSSGPSWDAIALGRDTGKRSSMQPAGSKLIPGSGHGILATNGPGRLTAAVSFGPYGGFHGHFDKNSFVFFGFGQELGVDPGRASSQAYRLPIHREWYKASTGHNVILADGHSQKEAEGKCLSFAATDSYAAITTDAGPVFDGISHTRFLLLTPCYLLIVDDLNASDGKDHIFDWLYHNKGQGVSCKLETSRTMPGNLPEGYAYLRNVRSYSTSGFQNPELEFSGEKTSVNMLMTGCENDEVFTATGPNTSIDDRVPMVIIRKKGQKVRYVTLLEPFPINGTPKVKSLKIVPGTSAAFSVAVEIDGGEETVTFPSGTPERFMIRNSGSKILLKSEQ
jgi:rubrerythrin